VQEYPSTCALYDECGVKNKDNLCTSDDVDTKIPLPCVKLEASEPSCSGGLLPLHTILRDWWFGGIPYAACTFTLCACPWPQDCYVKPDPQFSIGTASGSTDNTESFFAFNPIKALRDFDVGRVLPDPLPSTSSDLQAMPVGIDFTMAHGP
jgi:hypothetical protein